MFRYTDDPLSDYAAYEAELAWLEKQVPVCMHGDHPVMEDHYYGFSDEQVICAEHLDEYHKCEDGEHELICDYCGHAIEGDEHFHDGEGQVFCPECVDKHYKKEVVIE